MSEPTAGRATYTHGHHESVLRSHAWRTVDNSAAYLVPHLRPGLSLLDVGSGPGTITVDLAERLAPGRVVGVDSAAGVVAQATELAAGRGVDTVEFVVADLYELPFADDSFDVVHAHQVLQHVADPVGALREMRRVARPGGVVAVREVDYHGTIWAPDSAGLDRWMDVYQQVHRGNGGEPDAGRRLKGWALEAGFEAVASTAGRPGRRSRRSTATRSRRASRRTPSCTRSPTRGARGATPPTGGCSCRTARSSRAPERGTCRPQRLRQRDFRAWGAAQGA
jgi:SAM-dependent methyltransferase